MRLPESAHIMPSRCWAIKLASARYFESEVFLIMAACKPTTARTPMEKIRIAISDSSSTTPCWDAGEETGLLPFIYFSSLTCTWVGPHSKVIHLGRRDTGSEKGRGWDTCTCVRGHFELGVTHSSVASYA